MATDVLSSRTIRGITYNTGQTFVCASAEKGTGDSEGGSGVAAALTKGATYYFLGYSVPIDSSTTVVYPCRIGTSSSVGSTIGWFKESVFPYATYKVTYDANGGSLGSVPSSQTKTYGTNIQVPTAIPSRTGYTFVGWSVPTRTDVDSKYHTEAYYYAGNTIEYNGNQTLKAVWSANSYTYNIVYKSSSGTQLGTSTATYKYGTTNTISPKAFTGYTSPSSQSVAWDSTSAKTITFTYTPTSYNVTINCNGGSGISSRTYTIETATFSLGTPTRIGYTFTGWTGSNGATAQTSVSISKGSTGDKSYTANWSENILTINYYSNYATYGVYKDEVLNVSATTNVLVDTQKHLYDNEYPNGMTNIQNSVYLYLSRIGYTPTGYWGTSTNGGKLVDQNTSFDTGQALAEALGKDLRYGNASVDVYVQWNINTYTISYNANGGNGSMNQQFVKWNDIFTPLDNAFKREGYKFVGWNVKRDVDNTWYVDNQGWLTEDEIIANGYEKKVYNNQDELTFNDSWVDGNEYEISQYYFYAVWEISGVVYIDNGTTFEPYLVYIDNGTNWDLYLAYVDDGINWNIMS